MRSNYTVLVEFQFIIRSKKFFFSSNSWIVLLVLYNIKQIVLTKYIFIYYTRFDKKIIIWNYLQGTFLFSDIKSCNNKNISLFVLANRVGRQCFIIVYIDYLYLFQCYS